jgi:hypothetical protein
MASNGGTSKGVLHGVSNGLDVPPAARFVDGFAAAAFAALSDVVCAPDFDFADGI